MDRPFQLQASNFEYGRHHPEKQEKEITCSVIILVTTSPKHLSKV